jgi:hypothetical protein
MRRFTKKQYLVAGVAAAIIAGTAGSAIAYWTTSGGGTGSATTGSGTAVTVTQVGTVSALVPAGPAGAVDFKINNPASTPQYISTVAVSITGVTGPNINGSFPCTASDFTLVQPTAINAQLPSGDSTYAPSGASLALTNSTTLNQDGCKGATVALAFNAS